MHHNVRRYVALASRCIGTVARVFALVVRCRYIRLLLYSRVGKNRDTRRECPAGAGPAGWFLPGGFSREAGLIKHQLVLVCQSDGPARKNQSKPMTYTDLLCPVIILYIQASLRNYLVHHKLFSECFYQDLDIHYQVDLME